MENFLLNGNNASFANSWWIYVVLIALILIMLIVPMFGNRKRAKEYNDMLNNIKVGDTIRTVGGVIGRITKINEKDGYKTIIVETGAKNNKTTMEFDMASIAYVFNKQTAVEAKSEAKQEEKPAEETKTEVEQNQDKVEETTEVKVEEKPKTTKKSTKKSAAKTSTKKSK